MARQTTNAKLVTLLHWLFPDRAPDAVDFA